MHKDMVRQIKKGGVVGDLVSDTGGLIVLTIIVLVIVSTILGANLLTGGTQVTATETTLNEVGGYINTTGYQLGTSNSSRSNYVITQAVNYTDGTVILVGNYSVVAATGIVTNATTNNYANVSFNYTFTATGPDTIFQRSSDNMGSNFTNGIDNVSGKIPTILLIGAVVLLFGVIVLLMKQAGAMGIGGRDGSL